MNVRIWLRRERLTAVRRSICRTAFLADEVFAIEQVSQIRRETAAPSCTARPARQLTEGSYRQNDHLTSTLLHRQSLDGASKGGGKAATNGWVTDSAAEPTPQEA